MSTVEGTDKRFHRVSKTLLAGGFVFLQSSPFFECLNFILQRWKCSLQKLNSTIPLFGTDVDASVIYHLLVEKGVPREPQPDRLCNHKPISNVNPRNLNPGRSSQRSKH